MCLAIPGQIVELVPDTATGAIVSVVGVRRRMDLGLLQDDMPVPGDWVLIHVGFAMSKISEADAREQMRDAHDARRGRRPRSKRPRVTGWATTAMGRSQPDERAGADMKYVDEFRDPELITRALDEIRRLADPGRHYRIMEVCGGHTHAIYRFGLKDVLPQNIELIHGPGCPVCVLPMGRIDDGLSMAEQPEVIFAAFGDMMRVPGTQGQPARHQGARHGRPHRLFAARRAQAGPCQPRSPRHVLRHRLRDNGAFDRADPEAREGRGHPQLLASSATT